MNKLTPEQYVSIFAAALTLVKEMGPGLSDVFKSGAISAERQQELKNDIALIESGEAFNKPNWQPDAE